MSAVLDSVAASVLPAPMAGGPTTPALVRAACAASSFGTLAWGTCSVEAARTQVFQLAAAGCERFGVNLFHPQTPLADAELTTARALAAEFAPGDTCAAPDYSFGWDAKLQLALSAGASVVWSMFGAFSPAEVTRIHSAGAEAWTTVTTIDEAQCAAAAGVDVLCVQGPAAGGHRGTWDVRAEPDPRPLPQLVREVAAAVPGVPLLAAGGARTSADVTTLLNLPHVRKVVCGSPFLLAEEAGTSRDNSRAIAACGAHHADEGLGDPTVTTRAFSGRYARGIATRFTEEHPDLPAVYPLLNRILAPRRKTGDPDVAYCLVGARPSQIRRGSTAGILSALEPQ
ncbi:nitronate monooxygenase [Corynebacterium massiliense]|uniref:Propionate 3-nitronate monooxygenase n=1 Tax=Corynebacterium massiliense DSM 45435 TaxID=1121364 RepID=A0ABY7U636_9CORY|nr:nitronate monooxygenase [Corynebacterium massiliense]WCZ32166.1 Nitronate monooxygenase [Corynebacterium massiliense DSM 45435]